MIQTWEKPNLRHRLHTQGREELPRASPMHPSCDHRIVAKHPTESSTPLDSIEQPKDEPPNRAGPAAGLSPRDTASGSREAMPAPAPRCALVLGTGEATP